MATSDDNIVNNYTSTIISIYQNVVRMYERNKELIQRKEAELNDLNHEIELGNAKNACEGYRMYKEIRDARTDRRIAKEENELLEDLYFFLTSPQGQSFKQKVQSIQGNSVRVRNAQKGRTYHPKQRTDLTIEGKHKGTRCFGK